MERQMLEFATESEWLEMRKQDVTSTEVSALFGCCPYMTEYELFHRKTGALEDSFRENERMRWGKRLESAIAYGVAEDIGLIVEPFKVYGRVPSLRMGSSFDFRVIGLSDEWAGGDETFRDLFREHGPGIMEVKNVDGLAFRQSWLSDAELEAPPHIELQVQHQMEVAGLPWAIMAPLVNGNTPRPVAREYDADIGAAVRAKVADFWSRLDAGDSPEPDFAEDADAITALFGQDDGTVADMTENNYLVTLASEYRDAASSERASKKRKNALKAEILTIIGGHAAVKAGEYDIQAASVESNAGTLVTEGMLGRRIGGRRGYRALRINDSGA